MTRPQRGRIPTGGKDPDGQTRDDTHRADSGTGPHADLVRPIGQGIRSERKRLGWTMAELGSRADLTPQAIGMIERGETDPSLNSLRRISEALGIPMFQFLLTEVDRDFVVRSDARVRIAMPTDNMGYELLSSDTSGNLELLSVTLHPGAITRSEASAHVAEECTVVIRGTVEADIAGTIYQLDTGDCVTIRSGLPHRFINRSDEEVELLMALSPSTF